MPELDQPVPLEEVLKLYPHLEEWFNEHNRAQLKGNERLPSADEKMERLGGTERVKANLDESLKRNDPIPGILQACRFTPMVGIEIIDFLRLLEIELGPATLWYGVTWVEAGKPYDGVGTLERVHGLTLIQRQAGRDKWVIAEREGVLTKYEGLSEKRLDPLRPKYRIPLLRPSRA